MIQIENLPLVTEWDKTFPKSDLVNHEKVTFPQSPCAAPSAR